MSLSILFDDSGLAALNPAYPLQALQVLGARAVAPVQPSASLLMAADELRAAVSVGGAIVTPNTPPDGVAVVKVHGVITQRSSLYTEVFGGVSLERLQATMAQLRDDSSIRTIVLHVNSPGGGVYGVDETAEVIAEVGKRKRVIAFTDGQMASAAYWLATAAERIVATPSAEVGSIGVYTVHFDMSGQLDQMGLKATLIKSGEHKAESNPYQPLSDEDAAAMKARCDAYYSLFTKRVARGRGVAVDAARGDAFGAGRIVGAPEGKSAGMVDDIGTFADVLRGVGRDASARAAQAADERLRYEAQFAAVAC